LDPAKINDLQDLEALLELMGRHGLSELEIEGEGRKIRLRKPEPQQLAPGIHFPQPVLTSAPAEQFGGNPAPAQKEAAGKGSSNLREVTSPMVGTFYRAQSPEADPFVQEGDRVEENSVLCLIEAMKVMNEIPAGIAGVVREILVKNGESVEYGQPLFRISPE
jgi:acetyl-CoA carboxylase biotin carboxyl carrier protein